MSKGTDSRKYEREAPKARVLAWIKDPVFGEKSERKFVELLGFRNVNTTISRKSSGSATVSFPNFKSALIKYVSAMDVARSESLHNGKETTNAYAVKYMEKLTAANKEGTSYAGLWEGETLADATANVINPSVLTSFTKYSRSRGDLVRAPKTLNPLEKDLTTAEIVDDEGYILAIPALDVFDPIFVDYLGQDGFWYAGFTGLITKIGENYSRTGDQSITINCRDLDCLLDNVSLVSGWNRMPMSEQSSNLKDFAYATETNNAAGGQAAFSSVFDNFKSVQSIIEEVIRRSQDMWRMENNGEPSTKFKNTVGVKAFRFDMTPQPGAVTTTPGAVVPTGPEAAGAGTTPYAYPYNGVSGRRGFCNIFDEKLVNVNPTYVRDSFHNGDLEQKHYLCDPPKGGNSEKTSKGLYRGSKKLFIDPLISRFDQLFIHKLLNNSLSLFKDSMKSANQILNDIVAKMYAYKYFDANGNLIIELARPNAFPNLEDYGGQSTATLIVHAPAVDDKTVSTEVVLTYPVKEGQTIASYIKEVNDKYLNKPEYPTFKALTPDTLYVKNGGKDNKKIFGFTPIDGKDVYWIKFPNSPVVGDAGGDIALETIKSNNIKPKKTITVDTTYATSPDFKDPSLPQFNKEEAYKAIRSWTTLQYHGRNYVLTPSDFISFTTNYDEAPLVTAVTTDVEFPFLKIDGTLASATYSLHSVAVADFDMLAKLGVRRFQASPIYNVVWPSPSAGSRVLSYQAAAVMERINSVAKTGTIVLNRRPDLQLGRTFINPLRMTSHVIEGISNSWSPGGVHSTTLTLEYGHPIHKTLEVPWLSIFAEPELFFGKDGINVLEKMQALDINDKKVESTGGASAAVEYKQETTATSATPVAAPTPAANKTTAKKPNTHKAKAKAKS